MTIALELLQEMTLSSANALVNHKNVRHGPLFEAMTSRKMILRA